ncbi:MAG: hypothetical protein RLZZ592_2384 [Pseudomonadota bacterium]
MPAAEAGGDPDTRLLGIDFSSRPDRHKPIVVAEGRLDGLTLRLQALHALPDAHDFSRLLHMPGPWLGAFDLPFGLPRELVEALGWPDSDWAALIGHYRRLSRPEIRATFAAFCAARPVGAKFAHRACDRPAGASPSMKWVNPPVAFMLHAGAPALLDAGCHLPGLHAGDHRRIALEAYPGRTARAVLGRTSYKSDERRRQDAPRHQARERLLAALTSGQASPDLGMRLQIDPGQHQALVEDARGDRLDAVLCLLQAAEACRRPNLGLPARIDPLEGWITGVPCAAPVSPSGAASRSTG